MRLVIIESPFAGIGDTDEERAASEARHRRYLDRCILDCLRHGESPYASHQMLTSALRDSVPAEREIGIKAGFAWRKAAEATVVYTDHGFSRGMRYGIAHAEDLARAQPHAIEYREIGAES